LSLLTIATAVAQEAGFPTPGQVVGNSDDTAVLILALANRSGNVLAQKPWERLQKEYTFNLVASQASYPLTAITDLGYFQDYTLWDRAQFWELRGSLSAQEWQRYKSGLQSTHPWQRFRVWQNAIYIDPTPSTTDAMVIEYVSKNWISDSGGATFRSRFVADNDITLIPEEALMMDTLWRFLARKGLAYQEERDQAERYVSSVFANDAPRVPINMGGDFGPWPPLPSLPRTGFG